MVGFGADFDSGKAQQIQMQTFFGHSMISNIRFAALEKACAVAEGRKSVTEEDMRRALRYNVRTFLDASAVDEYWGIGPAW